MKIKQEDGTELEVFTQEEADALVKQKADEAAEAARQEAEAEKKELEEKLKKLEDKDYNFAALRGQKAKEDEASKAEAKRLADELAAVNARISKVESQPMEKAKTDFIAANGIEADKELKEKFDHFFEPLSKTVKSEADMKAALAGAFAAATGGTKQPNFSGLMVSTRPQPPSGAGAAETEASKEFGAAFGISAKDKEKYGKK